MIENEIKKINGIIVDSGIFDRWGGYCENLVEKVNPYGLGLVGECIGNRYSYDDRFRSVGYVYIRSVNSQYMNRLFSLIRLSFGIQTFTNTKKFGDESKFYKPSLSLFTILTNAGYVVEITPQNHPKFEMSLITATTQIFSDCEYSPEVNPELC